jgi:glycosyltransferase involved in cell wall biosynthesis
MPAGHAWVVKRRAALQRAASKGLVLGVALSLYGAARLARRLGPRRGNGLPRRVVHVSPQYFGENSYIGGGERYVMGLSGAMASHVETRLISFGAARESFRQGRLAVEIYRTNRWVNGLVSIRFLRELLHADVVHCHQYRTLPASLAILAGAALRKRVVVTDHRGTGHNFTETSKRLRLPLSAYVDCFLAVSAFSVQTLPARFKTVHIIYGGVDERFTASEPSVERERNVLFVGRLLPHKGINYLIEAIEDDVQLDVIGRVYDDRYFDLLKCLAQNKKVRFITDASDDEIICAYRSALVTVLPSVDVDVYGKWLDAPELLGLVLLESMACGTPVICTSAGAMPEVVKDGVTGFVVPQRDPAALRERITYLLTNPNVALRTGQNARRTVLQEFTWDAVARRCLALYRDGQ